MTMVVQQRTASGDAANVAPRVAKRARALAFAAALVLCGSSSFGADVTETRGYYESGGKKILVEQYVGAGSGKRPAIIMLHGSAGVLFPGLDLRKRARDLAAQGYVTFVIHFFNRTGHVFVRPSQVHENLDTWTATIRDGLDYISRQPAVDASRVATMGHSLGGYLALLIAARDPRVDAVIEASGALDASGIKRMPPTLILHGAMDTTVPVAKAERLEGLLKKLGTPYQKHIYPAEPHRFSRTAMGDMSRRIDRFLGQYFPARSRD